jgi:hypothetical protein
MATTIKSLSLGVHAVLVSDVAVDGGEAVDVDGVDSRYNE